MTQISTKPPSGTRDFLATDVARRRHVIGVIQRVYESFGFAPLETPAIEHLSTLLGKYGPEGDQLLYRLLHRRERLQRALFAGSPSELDLADEGLRYDLTVPLARVVANHGELPAFYKRYQIQPVWRADRPAKGRFREFWQCDVDVTGTRSMVADAEVCGAVATVLAELGFGDFAIHVNHRKFLSAVIAEHEIPVSLENQVLTALDKRDKIGPDGVKAELERLQKAHDVRGIAKLLYVVDWAESVMREESSTQLSLFPHTGRPKSAGRLEAEAELEELLSIARSGPAGPYLKRNPTLARGLSYYTGPIFEITCAGLAGSLGGGGRYDGLIGMFTKRQIPAVGFSLGLERILMVMEERGMFPDLGVGPQLLLCRFADVPASAAVDYATELRRAGVRVELFADSPSLGKQLQYAASVGVPFAGILGGDELSGRRLALKRLATGEQSTLPLSQVPAAILGN